MVREADLDPRDRWTDEDSHALSSSTGGFGSEITAIIRKAFHKTVPETEIQVKAPGPYDHILEGRKRINTAGFVADFKKRTHFQEIDEGLVTTGDPVGFIRVVDGKEVTYEETLEQARTKSKQNEAASYGLAKIGKNEVVEIVFNWDFMGASAGVAVAEKIVRATALARERNLDIVAVYCSGGQRQQEGAAALLGMDIAVDAMEYFKEETGKSITSVLVGNIWGGMIASAVLEGDLIVGMAGTNGGFAGPGVIEAYTGERPAEGAQTVENIYLTDKNVHMIASDEDELFALLEQEHSALSNNAGVELKRGNSREVNGFSFEDKGFKAPLKERRPSKQKPRSETPMYGEEVTPTDIYEQFKILGSDPRRPDTLFRLRNGYDWYLPFFSQLTNQDREIGGVRMQYPSIITAMAAIDDPRLGKRQWYGIIGNQPSYVKNEEGAVLKVNASPTAADLRHQVKMMEWFARLGLPLVSYTDTFGAKPTLEEERAGQYEAIQNALKAKRRYPKLTMGYITGLGGSGGSLATTLMRDHIMMLGESEENPVGGAQLYVAEPTSAANIVYKSPTIEDVRRTTVTMRPNAGFLKDRGIVDGTIPEPRGGAQNHPMEVILLEREDIIATTLELGSLTFEELSLRGRERMRSRQPIPINNLPLHPSMLRDVFHRITGF